MQESESEFGSRPYENLGYENSYDEYSELAEKGPFSIPLMMKKQNSVEKYINTYKAHKRQGRSQNDDYEGEHQRRKDLKSGLSSNASNYLFGKLMPEQKEKQEGSCYIKYVPVQNEQTQSRMEILEKMEVQYNRLKNNIEGKKDPYLSKFTLPIKKKKRSENQNHTAAIKNEHITPEKVHSELKRTTILENGKKYFADLYMLKKSRDKIKSELSFAATQPNKSVLETINEQSPGTEEQSFILQKIKKERDEKKAKMMQKKGLHWNVYYEMMALSEVEKKNLKNSNSKFYNDFGRKK